MDLLDIGFYFFYAMIVIAMIAAVGFALMQTIKTRGGIIRALIILGIIAVLFVVSYVLSGDDVSVASQALGTTASTSKMIGAGLIMFYIAFAGAILALIYAEITKASK